MTRGCRDYRLSEHNPVGQHSPIISTIDRHSAKNSQPVFCPPTPKALPIQGSGRAILSLWDGSELLSKTEKAVPERARYLGAIAERRSSSMAAKIESFDLLQRKFKKRGWKI